jgi:hypothetical protein
MKIKLYQTYKQYAAGPPPVHFSLPFPLQAQEFELSCVIQLKKIPIELPLVSLYEWVGVVFNGASPSLTSLINYTGRSPVEAEREQMHTVL